MTDGYLAFLRARDGEADLLRHTLSRREAFFDRLAREPVRSRRAIDRETFLRNLARRRPEPGLDDRMLWLLATAKVNQAERFGVGLSELYGKVNPDDPILVRIVLQEHYHTRILADALAIFGLPVHARPPALAARVIVKLLVGTPERWNRPLAGCAEMAGCVLFRALRDRGVELFADEPEVAATGWSRAVGGRREGTSQRAEPVAVGTPAKPLAGGRGCTRCLVALPVFRERDGEVGRIEHRAPRQGSCAAVERDGIHVIP